MSLLLALTGAGGSYTLNGDAGAYTIAGTAATLLHNRVLNGDAGAYALTGTAATLLHNRALNADPGAYVLAGTDATFVYTPSGTVYTLNGDPGSYSIAGTDASFVYTPANNQVWGGHWQPYWLDKREWKKKIPQKAVQAIERIAQSEKRGEAAEQALRAEISDFQTRYLDMLRGMQAMQVNTLQALRLMQMREIARIEQEIEDENNEFLLLM
jgi:hypothetical protein